MVPGTLRGSLFILDAILTVDGGPRPETVVTDTASYSDIVFGVFAICGYQFPPRIADLGDTTVRADAVKADGVAGHVVFGAVGGAEGRHRLARRIAFGQRGQLRQRYREGMEDQLGALGLALNAVVWWNTLYLDAAVKQIRSDGFPATDAMCARLSPIAYEHINFLGRYAFTRADLEAGQRPYHTPSADDEG